MFSIILKMALNLKYFILVSSFLIRSYLGTSTTASEFESLKGTNKNKSKKNTNKQEIEMPQFSKLIS